MNRPVVFLDADVIFAGAVAPTEHGASHVVLRMGELTLVRCLTSEQAVVEVERNLEEKLPGVLPQLRLMIHRSLHVVPDPDQGALIAYAGQADPKDLPILVAAVCHGCRYLLTFNVRHYHPSVSGITVQRPGEFLVTVRKLLAQMGSGTQVG